MSISIADNFSYNGRKAFDSRLQFDTVANMKAASESSIYDGCFSYVTATKKYYVFDASNEVDETTGKWREFEGGGGGGQIIQVDELPEPSAELEGVIYEYVGDDDDPLVNGYFYQCVSDGEATPTYSWEQKNVQPGSSGGGSTTKSITAAIEVGGIDSGTTYPIGTPIENILSDMLEPTLYPTLTNPSASMTATGAKLLEKGATLATTFTITFSRGSINPAYTTNGYRSGAATGYSLNGGTSQAGNTFSETITESQLTYQGSVAYDAGEQPKDSKGGNYQSPLPAGSVNTNTISYEFVNALYANTSNIATVAKLALVSKSAKVKEFNFPAQTVANPEEFHVDASWTITAVEVLNTLSNQWEDCVSEFTVTNTTHDDAGGNTVNYKKYVCNLGVATGTRKIRIKWS